VTRPASGAERHVRAKSETWHLTLWHGEGDSDPDAVAGRQRQARWFLARFDMYPLPRE